MEKYYTVIFLLLMVHLSEQKLKVTILYSTLCTDSYDFITNQLVPNYKSLENKIDLEFVPYGKASHTFVVTSWIFKCQHGERECKLNRYHACALKYASSQIDQVNFVSCMFKNLQINDESALDICLKDSKIPVDKVLNCNSTAEGTALVIYHGRLTNWYMPTLSYVPTIIFNNAFDKAAHDRALTEFLNVINDIYIYLLSQQIIYGGGGSGCYSCGQQYSYCC